jgi:hypothetical protein
VLGDVGGIKGGAMDIQTAIKGADKAINEKEVLPAMAYGLQAIALALQDVNNKQKEFECRIIELENTVRQICDPLGH